MNLVIHFSKRLERTSVPIEPQDFVVRTFDSPEDVDGWLELRRQAFADERPRAGVWTPGDFAREFTSKAWWRSDHMWVAESRDSAEGDRALAGAVTMATRGEGDHRVAIVHWLIVSPQARRRGLATRLLSILEAAAWQAEIRRVLVETHTGWQAATRFYQSRGYERLPRAK